MIQVEIVEINSGEVVHVVEVKGASSVDDRKVERVEAGLLRNANTEAYFIRTIDTEEQP
jgi:translation elongation factor P/translation initiation factor 5A